MLPGAVSSLKRSPRRVGDLLLGSWARTLAVAVVLIIAFALVAGLALTGQLSDLRYTHVPVVHPYPPAGYYQNPFNPGDRGDLINAAEASKVKADLLADGDIELAALAKGDASGVEKAATSHALTSLRQLIADNNAKGLTERQEMRLESVKVGRLPDPNDPSVTWCVEERGTGTISYISKANGQVVSTVAAAVVARFWLVRSGDRYLIADASITAQTSRSG
jgi:hypothetical protein